MVINVRSVALLYRLFVGRNEKGKNEKKMKKTHGALAKRRFSKKNILRAGHETNKQTKQSKATQSNAKQREKRGANATRVEQRSDGGSVSVAYMSNRGNRALCCGRWSY